MADPINNLYMIVGLIAGFCVIAFAIWNGSKRFTSLEKDTEAARVSLLKELARIEVQHREDVKQLELEIQRQVVERRDDITKTSLLHKDDFAGLQGHIENTKSDIKTLLAKIEVNDTSIHTSQEVHKDLREEDKETKRFFADWIQRVEDRIENLRKEYLNMLTTFHRPGNNK